MNKRPIVSLALTAPWAFFVFVGLTEMASVRERHIPDCPSAEQIEYYVGVPAIACLLGLIGAAFSLRRKSPATLVIGFLLGAALFPFVLMYSGGV